MCVIGIIGGTGLRKLLKKPKEKRISTPYGEPSAKLRLGEFAGKETTFLRRHGKPHNIPPHHVPHRANLWAFKKIGVDKVISVSSAGSLKLGIPPGSILIPHDYINFWGIQTYHDDKIVHVTPEFSPELREILIRSAHLVKAKVFAQGIYVQTTGPRLETKAEIALLRNYGEIVGMNVATEATLASELNLKLAAICSVDNYCHGIIKEKPRYEDIVENAKRNTRTVHKILTEAMKILRNS